MNDAREPVCWEAPGHGVGPADILLRNYDPVARWRRALLGLAGLWGLALAAVLIPVLHFLLVPGLLLAGLFVAGRRLRLRVALLRAEGACPGCATMVSADLGGVRPDWPIWTFCPHCGGRLRIAPSIPSS